MEHVVLIVLIVIAGALIWGFREKLSELTIGKIVDVKMRNDQTDVECDIVTQAQLNLEVSKLEEFLKMRVRIIGIELADSIAGGSPDDSTITRGQLAEYCLLRDIVTDALLNNRFVDYLKDLDYVKNNKLVRYNLQHSAVVKKFIDDWVGLIETPIREHVNRLYEVYTSFAPRFRTAASHASLERKITDLSNINKLERSK